jgi:serine/threonine protein kinase
MRAFFSAHANSATIHPSSRLLGSNSSRIAHSPRSTALAVKPMGSSSSLLGTPAEASSYRFGDGLSAHQSDSDDGSSSGPKCSGSPSKIVQSVSNTCVWIGTSLEMPPKPFSLENYFELQAVVGTGMLGKVRLAEFRRTKKCYAIKSMRKRDVVGHKMVRQVEREREALVRLTSLRQPFTARFFGSLQTSVHVHLIMEFVPGGELFRRLHQVGHFTNDEAKFYAAELLVFLETLHANGFMYRDLKPENILVDAEGHVRVVDMGFVKKIGTLDERTGSSVGTPQYLAPEQLTPSREKRSYTSAVDWWAFACVLYEMVNGSPPFAQGRQDSPFELYNRILECKVSYPRRMHPSLKELLRKMLAPDAGKRLSDVRAIKHHAWFDDVDWDQVARREVPVPFVPPLRRAGDVSNFDEYPNSFSEPKSPDNTFTAEFKNF